MMRNRDRKTQLLFKRIELEKLIDDDKANAARETDNGMNILYSRALIELNKVDEEFKRDFASD